MPTIKIRSLDAASFIIACGIEPVSSERGERGLLNWHFEDTPEARTALTEFSNRSGRAEMVSRYIGARVALLGASRVSS